jgi:hypothetical protein
MGISIENVATEVRKIIKGSGYRLEMFTEKGDSTLDDREARRFFLKPSNIMVTISEEDAILKLHKPDTVELEEIENLHATLKNLSRKYRLNFDFKSFGHSLKPKDYVHQAIKSINDEELAMKQMAEGMSSMAGSTKSSYQLVDDNVKLIVRHSKPVDETVRGSRSRNIKALFIENGAGERFQYPHIHLAGARAMARHVSMGGTPYDSIGNHVAKLSEDYKKLQRFMRYAKSNNVVNEETSNIIEAIKDRYQDIRKSLSRLTSVRGYTEQVSAIHEDAYEATDDKVTELRNMFTAKTFDESLEETLPLISQIIEYRLSKDAKKSSGEKLSDIPLLIQKSESVSFHEPSDAQDEYASANILNFSEPKYEYGYKVRELASLIEDDLLSSFLSNISNNDDAMEALSKLEEKGINSETNAGIIVQNIMTQANEQGIFGKADSADVDDTGDEFAQQDTEDMPDEFDPPEVESKIFKDWIESITDDEVLFEEVVISEDEFVDFNRALATAKERMVKLPRMGDGSPLIRRIKGMCEDIGIEYDVKAEDLYAALSGEDVINEGEPRQYKGDGTDEKVHKDGEVIVIDAGQVDEYLANGWELAEANNDALDRVMHLAGIEPIVEKEILTFRFDPAIWADDRIEDEIAFMDGASWDVDEGTVDVSGVHPETLKVLNALAQDENSGVELGDMRELPRNMAVRAESEDKDEEEQIDEAQSEAQKAAFQKMLDAKNGNKEETTEEAEDDKDDEVEESIELDRVKHLAGV